MFLSCMILTELPSYYYCSLYSPRTDFIVLSCSLFDVVLKQTFLNSSLRAVRTVAIARALLLYVDVQNNVTITIMYVLYYFMDSLVQGDT
jgi:hypothetical protein